MGLVMAVICYSAQALDVIAAPDDPRLGYSNASPEWLQAVGKLAVPGIKFQQGQREQHIENCSATLVAKPDSAMADIIITAWHCLEYYRDLSKPIVFTLLPTSSDPISSEAYMLSDGGHMEADWAILKLYRAVPSDRVASMSINPGRALQNGPIAMAGY